MTPNTAVSDVVTPSNVPVNIETLLESEQKTIRVNTAQDYVDGKMYYGIKVGDQPFLLTSDRKMMPISEAKSHNIVLSTQCVDHSRFSPSGIRRFFGSASNTNAGVLFESIRGYIKDYVFLQDEDH